MRTSKGMGMYSSALASVVAVPATRQLIRYVVAGLFVTQLAAAIYSAAVSFAHLIPLTANVVSTGCGLVAGYFVHSRWSFANEASAGRAWQAGRFLLASFFGFIINSTWVWLLTTVLRLSPMAPVPLMIFATPWISFLLNRYWVFRAV